MSSDSKRHHAGYVSNQDIIHKCLLTYYDELSSSLADTGGATAITLDTESSYLRTRRKL